MSLWWRQMKMDMANVRAPWVILASGAMRPIWEAEEMGLSEQEASTKARGTGQGGTVILTTQRRNCWAAKRTSRFSTQAQAVVVVLTYVLGRNESGANRRHDHEQHPLGAIGRGEKT